MIFLFYTILFIRFLDFVFDQIIKTKANMKKKETSMNVIPDICKYNEICKKNLLTCIIFVTLMMPVNNIMREKFCMNKNEIFFSLTFVSRIINNRVRKYYVDQGSYT